MENEKLESIYLCYCDLVMDEAYTVLRDFHLAQDVCQEVFVKMSTDRIEKLKTSSDMMRFLRTVAHHRAIDYYRMLDSQNRGVEKLYYRKQRENLTHMEQIVEERNFAVDVFQELRTKNEQWYEIVLRICLYDEAPEIVARDLGISIGLLRTKYHRAKNWIRKHYEADYKLLMED